MDSMDSPVMFWFPRDSDLVNLFNLRQGLIMVNNNRSSLFDRVYPATV